MSTVEAKPAPPPAVEVPRGGGPTRFYRVLRFLDRLCCLTFFRMRVEGLENVPKEGGAMICANHQSYLDILVIGASVPRHVTFVARDTLADTAWLALVMRRCGAILVRRGTSDRAAIRAMSESMKAGGIVAIYPEGTRTLTGNVANFKGGAVMAARMAGVMLVPAGIRGAYQAWPKGRSFPLPRRIGVRFGAPIDPNLEDARDRLEAAVRTLMGDGTYGSVPPMP
jgi:1-acyl-sn-glycerol-3-phosphate acyltransferase